MSSETALHIRPPPVAGAHPGMALPMTDRQLKVAVIVGGTILALILAVVVMAACGLFTPHPIPNLQLPTI